MMRVKYLGVTKVDCSCMNTDSNNLYFHSIRSYAYDRDVSPTFTVSRPTNK